MFSFFLDFIFPQKCVHCGKLGQYVCKSCQEAMRPVEDMICPMCERRAIDGVTHPGCKTRYSLDGLISFYRYDGPVRSAVKRLKYKPYLSDLVTVLVNWDFNNEAMKQFSNDFIIVPVPLHPQRERERGFNQAALIGKAIAKQLSLPFQDYVLKRTRYTKPQVVLKGDERRKNLADAFTHNTKYKILDTNVLLIDDVWTTGSTMRACANVLKRAGAKKVWAMTVAR